MNIDRLLTQTVHVTTVAANVGSPDKYNNPGETTSSATYKGHLQQSRRWEDTADRNQQDQRLNLYLERAAAVLAGGDRVTIDDITYQLEGPPWPAHNPRLRKVTHVECWVRRTS